MNPIGFIWIQVLQLTSLTGPVFPSVESKAHFLAAIYTGCARILMQPSGQAACRPSERIDLAMILVRCIMGVKQTALAIPQIAQSLEPLSQFTCRLLVDPPGDDEQPWERMETFDVLLEAWVILATEAEVPRNVPHPMAGLAWNVYQAYLMYCVQPGGAAESDDTYEDDSLQEDRLTGVAMLGRLVVCQAVELLVKLLKDGMARVQATPQNPAASGALHHLEVCVSCAVHLLADTSEGEKPMVPDLVNVASNQCVKAGAPDPVATLMQSVFEVMQMENQWLQNYPVQNWDATLSVALVSGLARWSRTYLLLDMEEYGEDLTPI